MEVASEVAKCHPRFLGDIFGNFGKRIERLQNSSWCYCSSQRVYFHSIFGKFNYIFLIRNIELLKWHPILAPIIGAKTLIRGAKTLFRVAKWHLAPHF